KGPDLVAETACGAEARKPEHHLVRVEQRCPRQRVDAAGEHELRATDSNVGDRRIERLHAGSAIAHDGPSWHLATATQAQCNHASDVHFVRPWAGTAENDFIEIGR